MKLSRRFLASSLAVLTIAVAAAAIAYTVGSTPGGGHQRGRGTLVVTANACERRIGPFVPTAVVSVWHGPFLVARKEHHQGDFFTFRLNAGSYLVSSMADVPRIRTEVRSLTTTRTSLLADCGRLGQPAATATPRIRPDGRLASVVIVGNRDERLLPPPPWAAPGITRGQALRDGTSSVALGFLRPLRRHPAAIVYLAMLSEPGPSRAARRAHMVWIVEYPHTRFETTNGPCCHAPGVYASPFFLVVNPKTGDVRQTFGGPVRVRNLVSPPAPSVVRCGSDALAVSAEGVLAGAGHDNELFLVRNVGPQPCLVSGFPVVRFLTSNGKQLLFPVQRVSSVDGPFGQQVRARLSAIVLSSHRVASFWVSTIDIQVGRYTGKCQVIPRMAVAPPKSAVSFARVVNLRPLYPCTPISVFPLFAGRSGTSPARPLSQFLGVPGPAVSGPPTTFHTGPAEPTTTTTLNLP